MGRGRLSVALVPMVGEAPQPGLLASGFACLADRLAAALVLVVGGDVADPGVQPDAVGALSDDRELGAQHRRVPDGRQVGPFGLDVAEQRPRSTPGRSACRDAPSADGWRTTP
jgi:hypothetical protein